VLRREIALPLAIGIIVVVAALAVFSFGAKPPRQRRVSCKSGHLIPSHNDKWLRRLLTPADNLYRGRGAMPRPPSMLQ
jgi:hypothetical protein